MLLLPFHGLSFNSGHQTNLRVRCKPILGFEELLGTSLGVSPANCIPVRNLSLPDLDREFYFLGPILGVSEVRDPVHWIRVEILCKTAVELHF